MKKIFLLTALAAVTGLMTSCSNDDDFTQSSNNATVNDNTISFSTSKSSANGHAVMSRSGVSITSLDKFYVSALNADNSVFFSMEEFNYDSSTGSFSSTTPHYWPTTGSLSFYAINEKGTHSVDANNVPKYTYSSWKGETDLVGATVITGTKQVPYPLTFKHLLSQIYVSAEAANKTEALTYKLTSVKLNAPSTGTFSFATETGGVGSWAIDGTKATDYSYDDVLPKSFKQNGSVELSSLYWNILPTTTSSLNFTIEYQVLQNGVVICDNTGSNAKICTIENPNLQSGKRYRYNFLLTNDSQAKITFTATITDWDEETSADVATETVEPTAFELNKTSVTLDAYDSYQLYVASVTPLNSFKDVTWSSSDTSIATVDSSGLVRSFDTEGTTTITATTPNGLTRTCTVEVSVTKFD